MSTSPKAKQNFTMLFEAVALIQSPSEAKDFLQDLCTPAELTAMSDRLRVIAPILDKTPYRQIHQQTGVSVTTIGRVARYLTHGSGGYQRIWQRLMNRGKQQ
jgi:TrpR-related protein YerC/YecD